MESTQSMGFMLTKMITMKASTIMASRRAMASTQIVLKSTLEIFTITCIQVMDNSLLGNRSMLVSSRME